MEVNQSSSTGCNNAAQVGDFNIKYKSKETHILLLDQISCYGHFYMEIQGLCHQEEGQGNDKKRPA